MERVPIAALQRAAQSESPEVLVAGFVATIRVLKRMIFVIVQDRTGRAQVTIERSDAVGPGRAVEHAALSLTVGSAIRVRGRVIENSAVKVGGVELIASTIDIVGPAEPGLPVDEHSASDLQLDWRFLALRRPANLDRKSVV